MKKPVFIINGLTFSEKSGGKIALHALCHYLNKNGYEAYVYFKRDFKAAYKNLIETFHFFFKPGSEKYLSIKWFLAGIKQSLKFVKYFTLDSLQTPSYNGTIENHHIVVYPEIIDGNPLNAKHVVRWFLHKPGFHTGNIKFGENELYFFYQKAFNNTDLNPDGNNLLRVAVIRTDIFKQVNFGARKGTCYAVRKGKGKPFQHETKNSILIDNMSLKKIAKVFNQCEIFYSYDTKTAFSRYAVLCGCKSVVIPDEGVSPKEWQPEEQLRYGVAYGLNNMDYAEKTKHLVFEFIDNLERENNRMTMEFAQKCIEFFKFSNP